MTKKKILLIVLSILLLLTAVWGIYVAKHALHLYQARQEVKSIIAGGIDSVSPGYALQLLHEIDTDLTVIDKNISWTYPILNLTGKTTQQVEPAIKYLKNLVKYALLFEEPISPLIDQSLNSQIDMAAFLNGIFADQNILVQAASYSNEITKQQAKIDIAALPVRFQDDFLLLEPFVPLIKSSGQILPVVPDMIGLNEPATYLLLAQNHDELRGGGGFITAMGTATLNSLVDIDLDMRDAYQVDDLSVAYPLPPQPLQDYMLAGIWVPRDGNWSADFPTSAATVQDLYQLSTGQETRGVIAFDQYAVQQLMIVMGAIQVDPQQDLWVDASNVLQYMHDSWGQASESQDWWANRKDFVAILGKAMLQNLINTRDLKKIVDLGKTAHELMQSGHLMIYFSDSLQQQLLVDLGLDGGVQYEGGDFLYWVDSNIGFNKVDAVIQRKLTYQVDLRDLDNPTTRIRMAYTHPVEKEVPCEHEATYGKEIAYTNMFERCYWDYWRVYFAPGTELLRANVQFIPGEYLLSGEDWQGELDLQSDLSGLNMVGGLQILPTNKSRELVLDFKLSPEVLSYQADRIVYELNLIKQLGLVELPVEIEILIPEGYSFDNLPEGWRIDQNSAEIMQKALQQDNIFTVSISKQN
jgi:hypothetical protein